MIHFSIFSEPARRSPNIINQALKQKQALGLHMRETASESKLPIQLTRPDQKYQ